MIAARKVFDYAGAAVLDVVCRHPAGRGEETESSTGYGLVFVRRGCFVRESDGSAAFLDPTVAFACSPGQELRYDHPASDGDDCTALSFDETTATALWGGEPDSRHAPLPVSASLDLAHRWLLAAIRRAGEPDALYERTINLAAATLSQRGAQPVHGGRPGTRRARQQLVREAREALAVAPQRTLPALARELGVSPHHLSRIFHAHTGNTITQHRLFLRCRAALQRIADGEDNLGRLAVEVGFADQSHLTRTIRSQTGRTPTQVRKLLSLHTRHS